jgi:hypothetical protein
MRRHAKTDAVFDMTITLAHIPVPPNTLASFQSSCDTKRAVSNAVLCALSTRPINRIASARTRRASRW